MPKFNNQVKIFSIAVAAANEYEYLLLAQELIRVCFDEDIASRQGQETIFLLLECYQSYISLHLDELRTQLHNLMLVAQELDQA